MVRVQGAVQGLFHPDLLTNCHSSPCMRGGCGCCSLPMLRDYSSLLKGLAANPCAPACLAPCGQSPAMSLPVPLAGKQVRAQTALNSRSCLSTRQGMAKQLAVCLDHHTCSVRKADSFVSQFCSCASHVCLLFWEGAGTAV